MFLIRPFKEYCQAKESKECAYTIGALSICQVFWGYLEQYFEIIYLGSIISVKMPTGTINMLRRWKIKTREIWSSIWTMIVLYVGIVWVVFFLLVEFWGDQISLTALAYLLAASAITAGGCVAYRHLRIIQGTERASVLTDLDTSWAGSELESSRVSILELKDEFKDIKDTRKRKNCIRNKLRELQENDHKRYREIVAMVCFFETVGYFSKVGYILPVDALELYGPAIRNYDDVFRGHIKALQKQDREIYVNFLWLADKAKLK